MKFSHTTVPTIIPTKIISPIDIIYKSIKESIAIPLATFEIPLWYSTKRGAIVAQKSGGIKVSVSDDFMTRSIILEADNYEQASSCKEWILKNRKELDDVVEKSSRFSKLRNIHIEIVGRLIFVRFAIETGNASGHNMTTKAADEIADVIIKHHPNKIKYISVSGNYCTDKKVSTVNGIFGRGKRAVAELFIKKEVCEAVLKTSPSKICELNTKKNFLGSILAGSVRSANAHYANIILAMFLATGQDAANVVEASQGITIADMDGEDLYFSVTIPNLIVGTVGNGKNSDFAIKNLELMKCFPDDENSSKRLAAIIAATVLCSELSLMASQTNPGELINSHINLERNRKDVF
ncbi:MAG: hydroxymethylglutaryl-CoA reductase [Alphaproteobacteria bacterium]|nr:hydroxymethylglutaryl-CoA reductase [Alphaproteobacteria bacterium]